ncbi:hypothetical protein [Labilithrix luteola]|uniref:hypothetical protein n=1 Tax=Labilithrix luteola TaxID=1391654 RepID=UPI0011BA8552|nr:hypothetical protein [Labilithrix luteola]
MNSVATRKLRALGRTVSALTGSGKTGLLMVTVEEAPRCVVPVLDVGLPGPVGEVILARLPVLTLPLV